MCGINAIIDFKGRLPDKKRLVAGMNAQMIYRGPDGEGLYADSRVALGFRRLSIIDVEGGGQPLFNEDKSLVLIFNGEIYNYVELTKDLTSRGHAFASGSDAETILHLYEEKGEACLEDLRGMFAFVLWDLRRNRLFAARDRVGIKPLYMSRQDGALWLSSELKAIVAATGMSPTPRPASAYQSLTYCYPFDQRHTPIEEVTRLLPGEYLIADESGVALNRYWKPQFGGEEGILDRSDEEILETLEWAANLHLRSDVPVGILLSGGIDSSTLAALAARSGGHYSALSTGYKGRHAMDERRQAQATAASLGMDFIDIECDSSQFGAYFDDLVRVCDEPVGDIAAMAQWAIYQQAKRQGFKVLISGIGGDELMFGYPPWNDLGNSLATFPGDGTTHASLIARQFAANLGSQTRQVVAGPLAAAESEALLPFGQLLDQVPRGPDEIAAVLFGGYLVHNGCQLADKLGMGSSVEVRVPFLDHVLVEQVLALPLGRRFEIGKSKPLLRRLMRGVLPASLLEAPKQGFAPPIGFIEEIVKAQADVILGGHLVRSGWVDGKALTPIITRGNALPWVTSAFLRRRLGIGRSGWFLFRLLAFEKWFEALGANPCFKRTNP